MKRCPPGVVLVLCGLAACAAPAPARLTDEQLARCRALETAYREMAPDYASQRDALVQDPVAAAWVVRMFVRDLFAAREGRQLGEDTELLAAAGGLQVVAATRALGELRALGAVAVPTVVGDLLRHEQPQPRELGIEILAAIGTPSVPALREVAHSGEPKHRRAAARALGGIGSDPDIMATLRELAGDDDYTVRADALRGLRNGGEPARALLLERLRADADPFVRRVAAQALAGHPATVTALALVDYLERCKRDRDWPGEQAAQESLQHLAGTRSPRTPDAWRAFAPELDRRAPAPAATR